LFGLGGLAFAKTTGLNGGASGLMGLWVGFGVGVKGSAEGLRSVVWRGGSGGWFAT
jgi:hypothetical protein